MKDTDESVYAQFQRSLKSDAFPETGMSARAAQAIVESHMWTDSNPMLNLSSFVPDGVATCCESGFTQDAAHRHLKRIYKDLVGQAAIDMEFLTYFSAIADINGYGFEHDQNGS